MHLERNTTGIFVRGRGQLLIGILVGIKFSKHITEQITVRQQVFINTCQIKIPVQISYFIGKSRYI